VSKAKKDKQLLVFDTLTKTDSTGRRITIATGNPRQPDQMGKGTRQLLNKYSNDDDKL
jgi:hypothetical protein